MFVLMVSGPLGSVAEAWTLLPFVCPLQHEDTAENKTTLPWDFTDENYKRASDTAGHPMREAFWC
jgi:hypothetical protein